MSIRIVKEKVKSDKLSKLKGLKILRGSYILIGDKLICRYCGQSRASCEYYGCL